MKSKAIKILLVNMALAFFMGFSTAQAQNAVDYFNSAAKQYVNNDKAGTGQTLAEGISKYPNNQKLRALLDKLQKEEQDKDQQQDQQDKDNNKDQQQQSEDQKKGEGEEQTDDDADVESEKSEDKKGEKSQQEKPSEEPSDQKSDLSEREQSMQQMRERLQDMNISPEQAKQILDAMNDAELRHIQQNKKKPTKKPEKGLPDW